MAHSLLHTSELECKKLKTFKTENRKALLAQPKVLNIVQPILRKPQAAVHVDVVKLHLVGVGQGFRFPLASETTLNEEIWRVIDHRSSCKKRLNHRLNSSRSNNAVAGTKKTSMDDVITTSHAP